MSTTQGSAGVTGSTATDWQKTPPAMGTAKIFDGQKTLGNDSFLKLLVTELQYQDPMKPMENRDFVAQMAQFSALEQMQNMNGDMGKLLTLSLLGKSVTGKDGEQKPVIGAVTGISFGDGGKIALSIKEDGSDDKAEPKVVALADVTKVNGGQSAAAAGGGK
ncbi:MAG TPA: flagellar hook capping FlgD N-terminal domain-containing protein [Bacillota bacterium]|jgi:flagellar basal-body rod modification protein FlgD